jgi:hypothetical protein
MPRVDVLRTFSRIRLGLVQIGEHFLEPMAIGEKGNLETEAWLFFDRAVFEGCPVNLVPDLVDFDPDRAHLDLFGEP